MPSILTLRSRLRGSLAALAATLLLAGCAGLPALDGTDTAAPVAQVAAGTAQAAGAAQQDPFALLRQAEQAASPQRELLLLQVAHIYDAQGDSVRLGRVLQEIKPGTVDDSLLLPYSLLQGSWALSQRQWPAAAGALLNPALDAKVTSDRASAIRLHALRAELYEAQRQPVDALQERIRQGLLVSDPGEQALLGETTWRLLLQLSDQDLQFLDNADTASRAEEQLLAGWVALARVQRTGFDRRVAALNDWRRSWPLHPANRHMPAEMAAIGQQQGDEARIALLLPLTGKRALAGQAVRDGFLSAHYRHLADGTASAQIDVIDSNAAPDLLNAYQQAVAQGAKLVIGPLEREQVQLLASQPSLPVPTLALNNPPNPAAGPQALYQFSLNPEDDVQQVAEGAMASGLRRALVIAPQGERGERLLQAFLRHWQQRGGEITAQMRYAPASGNYSVPLAQALGLDLASGQFRPGATLPDMVFFVGNATDAAQMVETLARNNAGQVPVYATAQSWSNRPEILQRAEGLRIALSPWQAGTGPLRETGEPVLPDNDMLYAMGADARELYPRLSQLRSGTTLSLPGNTGYLGMDGERRIVRRLVWGVVQGGQLRLLPAVGGY